jgi:hypothetical protein
MNDLRSTAKALGRDGGIEPTVTATPPRIRPVDEDDPARSDGDELEDGHRSGHMPRRQSILERVRQESLDLDDVEPGVGSSPSQRPAARTEKAVAGSLTDDEAERESTERFIARSLERRRSGRRSADSAPDTRPSRRREVAEEQPEEDRFPWHFNFDDDDEPAELQASTPLLSRAFRSTTG